MSDQTAPSSPPSAPQRVYSTGGFATVDIARPVAICFGTLTNPNLWPEINLGVTEAISPPDVVAQKGATFRESITSPTPGVADWSNEWLIEEFEPNRTFVISGRDNFSRAPIRSRLTYLFTAIDDATTRFERRIDVTLDEEFTSQAAPQEVEALYRRLGAQWEMARHLKAYLESH